MSRPPPDMTDIVIGLAGVLLFLVGTIGLLIVLPPTLKLLVTALFGIACYKFSRD